ncbi:MAG: alpha/beta hydrolase [Chitinophagaceae bacterium]|nr:alpha/beta hydrolase [Chitinophagaceae bacterium]
MNAKMIYNNDITFKAVNVLLQGTLAVPENAKGIVLFCHGINSSRHSPRNTHLARVFNNHGLATLLVSLEKVEEDLFLKGSNLTELAERVTDVTQTLMNINPTKKLPVVYFGSGTGAAVALVASLGLKEIVKTIVCRDASPESAVELLAQVKTPVLFICAQKDKEGIAINEMAKGYLKSKCELKVIENASYLFEEEGKLDEVAQLSIAWYKQYLIPLQEASSDPSLLNLHAVG